MEYGQYITKKRTRFHGLSGPVNIPWGTILPVEGEYIFHNGRPLCAVQSQNAKDHFWGYGTDDPRAEIKRQETAAALLAVTPNEDAAALSDPFGPWRKYGHLEVLPGFSTWAWDRSVEDMTQAQLDRLLECARTGKPPTEVPQ